jgi:hypothetical protein
MKLRSVLLMLAGSLGTYVVVACASSTERGLAVLPADDRDAARDVATDAIGSVIDALDGSFDGPRDAKADDGTSAWSTVSIACDKPYPTGHTYAEGPYRYAEQLFPGRSKASLARSMGVICPTTPDVLSPSAAECTVTTVRVRDGAIVVPFCQGAASVTLVVPPS